MKKSKIYLAILLMITGLATETTAQKTIYVRPAEIDDECKTDR